MCAEFFNSVQFTDLVYADSWRRFVLSPRYARRIGKTKLQLNRWRDGWWVCVRSLVYSLRRWLGYCRQ